MCLVKLFIYCFISLLTIKSTKTITIKRITLTTTKEQMITTTLWFTTSTTTSRLITTTIVIPFCIGGFSFNSNNVLNCNRDSSGANRKVHEVNAVKR